MGMNPALLNKYAFPGMREADSVFLNRWRKQQEEEIKGQMIDEAQTIMGADAVGNFSKAMDMMVRGGIDRRKARTELLGMMTPDELNDLGGSMSWDGKLTWEEKYPNDVRRARRAAVQGEVSDYESEQAAMTLEGKQWFDQVQEMWEKEPPSDQEIAEAERYMSDNFNYVDGRLGERWKSRSTDAESKQYYMQQFEQLDRAGMLTEAMLNDPAVPSDVRRSYLESAQRQDKARKETPEFKQYTKQIEADLKRHSGQETLDTIGAPGYELALAKAQAKFQRDMMNAISGGASPAEAAAVAYSNFQQELQQGASGIGAYTIDPENGFTRLIPTATGSGWQKHKAAVDNILSAGVTTLDSHALIPEATLKEAIKNINSPNYSYPPIATYISDRFGGTISPWEVLNRQAKARGLGELPMNPRLQVQTQGMRPEFVRMLHYKPSYNRVSRAYASVGNFNPDMVPKGYGNAIAQASAKYGIPPSILAGLLEVESSWNDDVISGRRRSSAGAVGIAQIMPGYHPTVDPTNALASIDYAAKYLSQLQQQLGSLDEAIYAYNGGPGGIRKSAENRAYQPKVMRAAAKYGYNPTGGSPWRNPALLNPRVAYITGDIMPGGAKSEHLDIKQADGGRFAENALDRYVEIEDPEFGRVAPSTLRKKLPGRGDNFDQHVARGSHGIDYPTANGSKVFLKGGARVVGSQSTAWGDKLTIQLPNGKKYTFLHGRSA